MANLLQSSQNKSTEAPEYYNQYLQGLATKGGQAFCNAQFIGAQPLQQQAFTQVGENAGAQQPNYQKGMGYVGCAAAKDISGAATNYLKSGTSASPLCAARPLICKAEGMNLGQVAQCYMNPYINTAVQGMSDIANRNIQQNLSPQAVAGLVGSGQFGSQRGAQVLGQVNANAMQDLNNSIAQMETQGFGQGLCAAKAKESALGQLAGTTVTGQTAQNQANLTAGATAACAAARCASAKNAAGLAMGDIACRAARTNLACINAESTLGAQCQAIKQNEQCFAFNKLGKLASVMQGQAIPTSVKTTMCMSPLSGAAALGSLAKGFSKTALGKSIGCKISKAIGGKGGGSGKGGGCCSSCGCGDCGCGDCGCGTCCGCDCCCCSCCCSCCCCFAKGGLIHAKPLGRFGCASTRKKGGLPKGKK